MADTATTGFYCSTSGTTFTDKESLAEHYRSDYHRYNLKRKVAGLPPVTKEWFDARKAQLATLSTTTHQKVWYDPLTKRKFNSENTYLAHVNSKKYQDLVKKSGQPAPAPIVALRKRDEDGTPAPAPAKPSTTAGSPGFSMAPVAGSDAAVRKAASALGNLQLQGGARQQSPAGAQDGLGAELEEAGSEDGWETASEDEAAAAEAASSGGQDGEEEWEEWDLSRSFFDNHISSSMQDNLEYMWKRFGFYLPDAEYLTHPEGLLNYLGQKLQYGRVPLYMSGDDPNAKQFRSLHAVQRHMVDTNQCKMLYDGNEDEYAEFYDYSSQEDASNNDGQLIVSDASTSGAAVTASGYELAVGSSGNGGGSSKVLGSRALARYYKQRPRLEDTRQSVVINTVLAKYRSLGIETQDAGGAAPEVKRAQRQLQRQERSRLNLAMRTNINNNLPNNVPY